VPAPRLFDRLLRRTRDLWQRAKREHSTPREIAWAVAIGVFSACTPPLGLHMWIALALATAFRLSRLWAFLGSRASVFPIFFFVVFGEIEVGHRLRGGAWLGLSVHEAFDQRWGLLADWLIGTPLVAGVYAALLGALTYAVARRVRAGATATPTPTPVEALPPTSESPPSAPPAPTP
jgi:uncharacterized protein (DUF2062 family)